MTWSQMEFDHEVHQRTAIQLICASEELIDVLEENQVRGFRLRNTTILYFITVMVTNLATIDDCLLS